KPLFIYISPSQRYRVLTSIHRSCFAPPGPPTLGGDRFISQFQVPQNWEETIDFAVPSPPELGDLGGFHRN
ncbi:MAG: hypothetical protein ACKN9E_11110, partial [Microcystaceae cyanobacterium]